MLDPIQNQALRLCLGAFRTSPVESLQVEANEPPLTIRRDKLAIQYVTRLLANPRNPAYNCTFNPQYEDVFKIKPKLIPSFGIRMLAKVEAMRLELTDMAQYRFDSVDPWTAFTKC